MDDGLYSPFQDWKLECEHILDVNSQKLQSPGKSTHSFDGLDHSV